MVPGWPVTAMDSARQNLQYIKGLTVFMLKKHVSDIDKDQQNFWFLSLSAEIGKIEVFRVLDEDVRIHMCVIRVNKDKIMFEEEVEYNSLNQ